MLNIDLPSGGRRTAHELVRDALRQAILRGALPGGSRLVQAEIASRLDVSTTPVREALRDLASEGLIRLDSHRGAIVRQLDFDDVREIYSLRMLLEPEAMRRAAQHITDEELKRAAELQLTIENETDAGVYADLNREFHAIFVNAARSPRLIEVLQKLRDVAAPYVGLSLMMSERQRQLANEHHRGLLEALRDRDPESAMRIVREHLESTLQALEEGNADLPVEQASDAAAADRQAIPSDFGEASLS